MYLKIDRSALQIPKNLKLADPTFHIPSPIEILLSSGPTLTSLCVGQIKIPQSIDTELCLQKTRFCWVIGGSPPAQLGTHSFHTTTRDLTTTTFPSSASQPSDSTSQNVLNQPIARDSLDRKKLNPVQDNKDQIPPTETITATQMAIPSHTTRSSPRDTHNVSPTRDLTTTFAASASQASDSTLHNVLKQSIARNSLDRKKLNPVQDDNGRTPPTEGTASTPAPISSHTTRSSPRDIRNILTTRDLTTTFAASASQPSDSTPQNVLNQSIARDPLDRKGLILVQDDNGHTPPTEIVASSQLPIPAHTTQSSPHDTRNVSTTRDRTTTLTAPASQPSDSTTQNVSNQPNAPDLLDREERNPVQYGINTSTVQKETAPSADTMAPSIEEQRQGKSIKWNTSNMSFI